MFSTRILIFRISTSFSSLFHILITDSDSQIDRNDIIEYQLLREIV